MEKSFKRIKNYTVSVKEIDNKVIFLRKLERGGSEHSFGIHVAKMAGMPKSIVKRANDILKQLETDNRQQGISSKPMVEVGETRGGMQLSFFQLDDPVLCQIRDEILNLDVNNLTPLEALNTLREAPGYELHQRMQQDSAFFATTVAQHQAALEAEMAQLEAEAARLAEEIEGLTGVAPADE